MYQVLYVDDDQTLLKITKLFMELSGEFELTTMTSAADAVNCPHIMSYDAIISDYEMPEMNGIAFLKAIKSESKTMPFLIFTGCCHENLAVEAIDNGADFFVNKCGKSNDVFSTLQNNLKVAIERRQVAETMRSIHEKVVEMPKTLVE